MKKTAILGMVLATTMVFSANAHPKKMLERAVESQAKIEESLYGKDKEGKVLNYRSLSATVRIEKQDKLIAQLGVAGKEAGLRDYLRSEQGKDEARVKVLTRLLAQASYGESLGTIEGKVMADLAVASIKLLANSPRAKDRNDEATLLLVKQIEDGTTDNWKATQVYNLTKMIEAQDRLMESGLDSNTALVKAYQEVKSTDKKKVTEEEAKAAVKKMKELC